MPLNLINMLLGINFKILFPKLTVNSMYYPEFMKKNADTIKKSFRIYIINYCTSK